MQDAEWALEQGLDEVDSFASTIAVLVERDDELGRPVFDPYRLLRACELAGDRSAMLVARAIEVLGPTHVRGRAARVVGAIEASVPDADGALVNSMGRVDPVEAFSMADGHHNATALYLRAFRPSGEEIAVRAFCEAAFRGAATEFGFDANAKRDRDRAGRDSEMTVKEVSLADARAWFDEAVAMRIEEFHPDPDDEDERLATEHWPIVAHYFNQCPQGGELPEHSRLTTDEEIPVLVAEFVASRFARGLDDVAGAAEDLAEFGMIMSGRPLWWSPLVAELFAQYAEPVLGPDAMQSMAPAIQAWVSWSGERLGKTPQSISETREAIDAHATQHDERRHGDNVLVLPGLDPAGDSHGEDEETDWLIEAWTKHESRVVDFVLDSLDEHRGAEPPELEGLAGTIRDGVTAEEWPFSMLAALSRSTADRLSELSDADVVLWATSVMIDPDPDLDDLQLESDDADAHPLAVAGMMDPIDWATVAVGLVRAGAGASCEPEALIDVMVELSQEADDDAEMLAMFFEVNRPLWRAAGVTNADDALTAVGVWALPRAFCRALGTEFD